MKKNRKKRILEKLHKRNKQRCALKFSDLKEWSLRKLDTKILCLLKVGQKDHIESLANGRIYWGFPDLPSKVPSLIFYCLYLRALRAFHEKTFLFFLKRDNLLYLKE